jgi:hemolysin III
MLAASAIYSTLGIYRYRALLKDIDQVAIFFMIGGTCSPLTLAAGGIWGIELFAAVWLLVAAGIVMIVVRPDRFERAAIPYYLASGWLVGLAALDALDRLSASGSVGLFVLGGVIYTGGIAFHRWHALPFQNALWHACVLTATCCQYVAIAAMAAASTPMTTIP